MKKVVLVLVLIMSCMSFGQLIFRASPRSDISGLLGVEYKFNKFSISAGYWKSKVVSSDLDNFEERTKVFTYGINLYFFDNNSPYFAFALLPNAGSRYTSSDGIEYANAFALIFGYRHTFFNHIDVKAGIGMLSCEYMTEMGLDLSLGFYF